MAFSFSPSNLSSVAPVCSNTLIKSSSLAKIMEENTMHDFDRATVSGCWDPKLFSSTFQETVSQGGDFLFQMGAGEKNVWAFLEHRLLWMTVNEVSFPKLDEKF